MIERKITMALLKLTDFNPNYQEIFGGYDLKDLDVYSDINNEKIGSVHDLLVDEQGHFRYFIVDLGFWGFGKKVLLPVGRSQMDGEGRFIRALGFTKDQAENLPEFTEKLKIDHSYEERVRGNYRRSPPPPTSQSVPPVSPGTQSMRPIEDSAPLEGLQPGMAVPPSTSMPRQDSYAVGHQPQPLTERLPLPVQGDSPGMNSNIYDYQQDPQLYGMNEQNHSILRRYEERLIASKGQPGPSRPSHPSR
jgi:stress response protein YsnF